MSLKKRAENSLSIDNEGRFDHSMAARRTVEVTSLEDADSARTASYTGILGECLIRESYLLPFAGYYQVSGTAEIHSSLF
jgi:hypothetical protein